jgi:DNA repair protein RecN (Recombination protein N)
LLDGVGGFVVLSREVAAQWRAWRAAAERRDAAANAAEASAAERDYLAARQRELEALGTSEGEWSELSAAQSRLGNAAALLEAATAGEELLADGDEALTVRLAQFVQRLAALARHDAALAEIVALLEPAGIQLAEAARALRDYRRRLDLDPAELARVEARLATLHDVARKHRVRPEALPALYAETEARLAALALSADAEALARAAAQAEADFRALAGELAKKRRFAANELSHRVSAAMQELAMAGGRFEVGLEAVKEPASYGLEQVEFRVSGHPGQPLGPLSRVASGGELSRIALAIQVVTSEVGHVPTLVFDEVDAGIGGAVAVTVGRLLQALGTRRQVLCVTHLPQVASCADAHYRVSKRGDGARAKSEVALLDRAGRQEEIARMLGGAEVTAKTRANAREFLEQNRRKGA